MKRLLFSITALLLTVCAFGQTQQGFVKTLGRPERKGQPLSGVTIRAKGEHNTVLSDNEGFFALQLTGKQNGEAYILQQVQKNGYELNEMDIIGRQQVFSDKVPLTLVMVSTEVLQAEKQRIESTAYEVAERNFASQMEQLEQQLKDSIITLTKYQQKINDLQDKFEKYQSLIDGLATHYAHTDYDFLNEKEREINICIENGDLERADSLINTLFDPIGVLERNMEALASIEQQIWQAQSIINQANEDMAAVLKQQEKDAEYLYQLYTIAAARFDFEKALHYIETRAELDSTRWEWQFDAGQFCFTQNQIDRAEVYYNRALDILDEILKGAFDSDIENANIEKMAQFISLLTMTYVVENNLATIYSKTHRLADCEELYLEIIDFYTSLFQLIPDPEIAKSVFGRFLATAQMGLSELYRKTNRFEESEALSKKALSIFNERETDTPDDANIDKAKALMMQGVMYKNQNELKKSEECYQQALEIHRSIAKTNPDNEVEVARTLHNYANLYEITKCYSESESMFQESLEIFRRWAKRNPKAYLTTVAMVCKDLAVLYDHIGRFEDSENLFMEALEIDRAAAQSNPEVYEADLALTLAHFGNLYYSNNDFEKCEPLYQEGHQIYQQLAQKEPSIYNSKLAIAKFNLASVYYHTDRIPESVPLWVESYELFQQENQRGPTSYKNELEILKNNFEELAPWLEGEAGDYKDNGQYEKSETYFQRALDIYRLLAKDDPKKYDPEIAGTLNSLGVLYGNTKRFSDGETAFSESLEIYQRLAKTDPTTYQSEVFRMRNNLAALEVNKAQDYRNKKQYEEAAACYAKVIGIRKALAKEDRISNYNYNSEVASALNSLAIVYVSLNQYQKSEAAFKESLEIYQLLSKTDAAKYESLVTQALNNLSIVASQLRKKANQNKEERRYSENEALLTQAVEIYRFISQKAPKKYESEIAATLGSLSYNRLFNSNWKAAEQAAREALALVPSEHWINANLAAALLFQGKYNEAEQICRQYKDDLKEGLPKGFDDLEAAGVIPEERKADVERIRQMLME